MRRQTLPRRGLAVAAVGAVLLASCATTNADTEGPLPAAASPAPRVEAAPSSVATTADPAPTTESAVEIERAPLASAEPASTTALSSAVRSEPEWCSYLISDWSVVERRGVNHRHVGHPYAETTAEEVDPFDPRCSVCEQDQVAIDPSEFGVDGPPLRVCWAHEADVRQTLAAIVDSGDFDIVELTGYRPGYTRGDVVNGLRTLLSHHSFGTAIDINAGANGLYRGCDVVIVDAASLSGCVLGIGGPWDPGQRPRTTITPEGVVVAAFAEHLGWRWGGEADGPTRDLMHFSLSGH